MSLAENFLSTAKELLMMTENVKRMDVRLDRLADDVAGVDRRLVRIETMVEISKISFGKRLPSEKL